VISLETMQAATGRAFGGAKNGNSFARACYRPTGPVFVCDSIGDCKFPSGQNYRPSWRMFFGQQLFQDWEIIEMDIGINRCCDCRFVESRNSTTIADSRYFRDQCEW
jgi:hypothetical protein